MPSSENFPTVTWAAPSINRHWSEARFVTRALLWKLVPWYRVPDKKLEQLKYQLRTRFAMSAETEEEFEQYQQKFEQSWPKMREKFRKNPSLFQFMLEYGVHSEFFYPFLMRVPQATTLELASGLCYDMLGRLRAVPRHDAMYPFIYGDEMFRWLQLRMDHLQEYLCKAETICSLGGGMAQVFRYKDYPLEYLGQEIVIYDNNRALEDDLRAAFPKPLEALGIHYHFEPMEAAFRQRRYQRYFDVIDISGVLSYRKDLDEFRQVLKGALSMLKPDGVLIFDLQVTTLTLLFDLLVLGWKTDPGMKPEKNPDAAIALVAKLCAELGASYEVICCEAIGVQFAVRPPQKSSDFLRQPRVVRSASTSTTVAKA